MHAQPIAVATVASPGGMRWKMEIQAMMVEELAQAIVGAALCAGYLAMAKEQGWDPADFDLAQGDLETLQGRDPSAPWQEECEALMEADRDAWKVMVRMVQASVRMMLAVEVGSIEVVAIG
jgi:hypothetical protein